MSRNRTKELGSRGEDLATEHLLRNQYEILDRNYRWARGEIDIVAKKNNTLIFVEVKTTRGHKFGAAETWVDERKQEQVGSVAERYLQEKGIQDIDCRFDVIAIQAQGERWQVRHIENAFWL